MTPRSALTTSCANSSARDGRGPRRRLHARHKPAASPRAYFSRRLSSSGAAYPTARCRDAASWPTRRDEDYAGWVRQRCAPAWSSSRHLHERAASWMRPNSGWRRSRLASRSTCSGRRLAGSVASQGGRARCRGSSGKDNGRSGGRAEPRGRAPSPRVAVPLTGVSAANDAWPWWPI